MPNVFKSGSLNFLEHSGLIQACNEIALLLLLILKPDMYLSYVLQLISISGGQMSSLEAITRGISVVGIPIFFDQRRNMTRAVLEGYGLEIKPRRNKIHKRNPSARFRQYLCETT